MVMFAAVWMVEIIWDIRDLNGDREAGVNTIPVVFGVSVAKWCVFIIDLFFASIVLWVLYTGVLPPIWYFILVNNMLIGLWIWYVGDKMQTQRGWSHTLVVLQVVLLVCVGMFAA